MIAARVAALAIYPRNGIVLFDQSLYVLCQSLGYEIVDYSDPLLSARLDIRRHVHLSLSIRIGLVPHSHYYRRLT